MMFTYDLETYLKPFNDSEIMFFETALPFNGEVIQTLFPIEEVIAVTNYGLDVVYEEGKDYIIKDKKLVITDNSRIKQISLDEYYRKEPTSIHINVSKERSRYKFDDDRCLMFGEEDYITSKQITISYKHKKEDVLYIQKDQRDQLNRFFDKLKKDKKATVVFYGDSITAGCNSSGTEFGGNTKPHAPNWATMVTDYLNKQFDVKINYVNTAIGGKNTKWGIDNVEERVSAYNPDLLVLSFGMNDGMLSKEEHALQIKKIIDSVRNNNPQCDIVLISPTIINPESTWFCGERHKYYEEYDKFNIHNLAIVNMTKAHLSLLKRKAFKDMTGNNINHPNDFLARVYAQAILQAMGIITTKTA